MVRAEVPKPRPILKPIAVGGGAHLPSPPPTPSPLRVTFAAVARDVQTGAEVPPSPRTREQFYTSVKERKKAKRRERRMERIEEIRAELEANKRKKKEEEEEEEERKRKREEEWKKEKEKEKERQRREREFAELEKRVREARAKARRFDRIVGFGLDEAWYPSMIECMRAAYC
ncbi:hypothetical protein F4811DRAFT_240172 [Daldinia bambusicola]|nr:hypothetical protein F4811DRAFT_240172 [Daldinia bambusicola]